jgi:general secretion pathway protein G
MIDHLTPPTVIPAKAGTHGHDAQEIECAASVGPRFRGDDAVEEEGFTLVELMVVILILGLLTTIVILNVLPAQDRAMDQKARTDIALLEQAMERYRLDMFTYPAAGTGLTALVSAPPGLPHPERYPAGGYIKRLPDDPWGNPYHYDNPGRHGPIDIYSFGADGKEGGDGQNADIGNWK